MADVDQRIECHWCHAQSPVPAGTCDRCGAPLDVRDVVTDSGWRETPRLRDLTEFHWASSTCQVGTGVVPVVDVSLSPDDAVYFEHHVMLWKDETVPMSVMSTPGGARRLLSGMPFVLSVAHGPGRVALSRDAPGQVVVLPIDAPAEVDLREHALLVASASLGYAFEKMSGVRAMLAAGTGMYLDRYTAQGGAGLLVLHGYGNVFERTLGEDETVLVEPGGFLYKDASVTMEMVSLNMKAGATGGGSDGGSEVPAAGRDEEAPAAAAPSAGGRFLGRLKAAKSVINVGAVASAAGNLRSGGGVQGLLAGLAGGGSSVFRVKGPGRLGIQSMYMAHQTG